MRTIDKSKKERIAAAVYQIVMDEGISALSFGKIAKTAGVSSGTPYVYYADKTDMLTKLFLDALDTVDTGLAEDIEKGGTIEEKIYQCLYHYVVMFHEHPKEAAYLRAINGNYALLDPKRVGQAGRFAAPAEKLFSDAVSAGVLADTDRGHISSLLFGPIFYMLDQQKNIGKDWSPEDMQSLIRRSIKAILA